MSGSSPWSIKGVSRQDREIAKEEARKSGEPIGVWLSRRIRDASADDPAGADRRIEDRRAVPAVHSGGEPASGIPAEGDRRQVVRGMGRRTTDHPDFGFGPGNWRQARETILAREDSRFSEGVAALRDRVRTVENRLAARPDAMAEVEERIRTLTGRIAEMAGRLETLETDRGVITVERKLDRLETDVMELDRFARNLPGETSELMDGLERRIEQLLDRMRVVEEFVLPGRRKGGFFRRMFGRKSR
ncbi:MAG: hypothetical protein P1U88_08880 [Thalassobaculaceae bacterium]|nr:hypothetical protein [Thalassobaculaceae bacterium]